ncbi:MAG: hypothetical protein A3F67_04330 [Verrucomicrobia bacterium RIFCSPHIGHO2_12_FULL_41_10]|nr:MAG: hypothetical protein A3F67_04330 [Verrucomicrobia bacterium RIFCSPHIGHO2_12_FULL_41_10]HLB34820.1 sialidase family protein [Chthoniobacterales bacterium]
MRIFLILITIVLAGISFVKSKNTATSFPGFQVPVGNDGLRVADSEPLRKYSVNPLVEYARGSTDNQSDPSNLNQRIDQPRAYSLQPIASIRPVGRIVQERPFYQEEIIDPDSSYPMAHVASMTELPDGTLAATWYAGSGEVQPDVKIYFALKKKGELLWSESRIIMTREKASHELQRYIKALGNALIFSEVDGTLRILYVTISMGKWSGSMLNLTSSCDGGITWKRSRRLFLSPFFNLSELVKNAPTPLESGGWAIPIYQEFLGKFPELLWLMPEKNSVCGENSFLRASKSRIAGGCSFFQPSMTAFNSPSAVVFLRDYMTSGKIWRTKTVDAGSSWSQPEPTTLPNHDSGLASLRLSNGWLLLAFNDSTTSRDNLRLALSKDEGKTWKRIATIAEEPKSDFSYPYFLQTQDGMIHLLYSWKRRHIHHVVFNEEWVRKQETGDRKQAGLIHRNV